MYPVSRYWFLIDVLRLWKWYFSGRKRENDHPTVFRRSTTIFYEKNSDDDSTMKKSDFFERKQYLKKSLVFGLIFCYFIFRSALLTTHDTLGRYSSLVFSHFLDFLAVFLPNNSSTKTNEEFTQLKDVYLSTMCWK